MAAGGQNLEELVRRIVSSVHNLTESSNTVISGNNAAGSASSCLDQYSDYSHCRRIQRK